MRLLPALCLALLLGAFSAPAAAAVHCDFVLGFNTLRDLIGHDVVGECLEDERHNEIGDSVQQTTGGLLVWRKADNWTAFTDGYRTWINGPDGLQQRLNTERFPWEHDDIGPDAKAGETVDASAGPDASASADTAQSPALLDLNPVDILAPALDMLRSTPSGANAYNDLLRLGVGVTFGGNPPWGQYIFDVPTNRIVLYGVYAHEAPDMIAQLVAEAAAVARWFHLYGEPTTPAECIERTFRALTARDAWLAEYHAHAPTSSDQRRALAHEYVLHRVQRDAAYCAGVPRSFALDPDMERALATMRQTPTGQRVYELLMQSGVSVFFEPLIYLGGVFSQEWHYIAINEVHRDNPMSAAAWLVHETVHALAAERPQTPDECYRHEEVAFSWQAQWWSEYFGRGGSGLRDSASRAQDAILRFYLAGNLIEAIRSTPTYQDFCSLFGGD